MDTGLKCLGIIAQFHQLPVDEGQLAHQFGVPGQPFDTTAILRAAKALTLKAKQVTVAADKLLKTPLPAIVKTVSGDFILLARVAESESGEIEKILIHDLRESAPQIINLDAFTALWSGELILLTRRTNLKESLQQVFDITWFIPSFVKYRRLFGEILIASFFLQLFALITPLFFQVIMDKVLVHRGLSTLDVIALGFFVISVFEVLLSGIRSYVLSHSTSRVDVELGARLFNHLLALPISYFESRQVGQSVARVHELHNIRNFITGSALTLVLDLFFTVVFIAVMWYYSPKLCWIVLATIPFYIILSLFITPILRHRLNEKFKYGAVNTSFLTEAVTGVQTVKAMSVEPQMQRKWEDQLANYVNASFRSQNLGNVANQVASYTLTTNVETLTLTGTASINGTGNDLANTLTGNSGANLLDGGSGNDTMIGGVGDDTYVVDATTDVITEGANAGTDTVQSSANFTLATNVENLTLTGSNAINATGNTLVNTILGNSAANVIDGGAGADKLSGGAGDDTYIVDNTGDVVTENANEGIDLVKSSIAYTLGNNIENLTLTGTSTINGTGNSLDNTITGNSAINTLTGNAGNDTLNGGAGNDSLIGGIGNDTYLMGRGYATDSITENDSAAGNTDVVQFGADISIDQLWFRHVGNNLEATIVGTTDKLVINNWYSGSAYHVEQFKTADGKVMLDSQVEALVSAMASFAPPVGVGSVVSQQAHDQLQPVLAASWH